MNNELNQPNDYEEMPNWQRRNLEAKAGKRAARHARWEDTYGHLLDDLEVHASRAVDSAYAAADIIDYLKQQGVAVAWIAQRTGGSYDALKRVTPINPPAMNLMKQMYNPTAVAPIPTVTNCTKCGVCGVDCNPLLNYDAASAYHYDCLPEG